MQTPPQIDPAELAIFERFSKLISQAAEQIGMHIGIDPLLAAFAMGHSSTSLLAAISPSDEARRMAAKEFGEKSVEAMENIIAERNRSTN